MWHLGGQGNKKGRGGRYSRVRRQEDSLDEIHLHRNLRPRSEFGSSSWPLPPLLPTIAGKKAKNATAAPKDAAKRRMCGQTLGTLRSVGYGSTYGTPSGPVSKLVVRSKSAPGPSTAPVVPPKQSPPEKRSEIKLIPDRPRGITLTNILDKQCGWSNPVNSGTIFLELFTCNLEDIFNIKKPKWDRMRRNSAIEKSTILQVRKHFSSNAT